MKQDERHHTSDDIFVGIDLATRQHQVVVLDRPKGRGRRHTHPSASILGYVALGIFGVGTVVTSTFTFSNVV